jgi:GNAT superfamily N-acetyltransferase
MKGVNELPSNWQMERRGATDPMIEKMVADYLAELLLVMPDFDPTRAAPTVPSDFDWPNGSFVLVRVETEPIACGALRRLSRDIGELRRMWVGPAWRGRGAGRLLLGALEDLAKEMQLTELRLDTNRKLGTAIALYRSAGFVEVQRYNDNEFADIWMSKGL